MFISTISLSKKHSSLENFLKKNKRGRTLIRYPRKTIYQEFHLNIKNI